MALRWSPYNLLFTTTQNKHFAYNALSNIMLELDTAHATQALTLRNSTHPTSSADPFIATLEQQGFLSTPEDEQLQLMERRFVRSTRGFNTDTLGLVICPTLACNFACPYCFEHSQSDNTSMTTQTIERLQHFIEQHKTAQRLSVTWYGGEPTLEFNTILELTSYFQHKFKNYTASIITNGYLLDQEKIDRLNELNITYVQITLDGNEQTHNARRMLHNNQGTFAEVLNNIEKLASSSYKGRINIRVNIDKHNLHDFIPLHTRIHNRIKHNKLVVEPARVRLNHTTTPNFRDIELTNSEWTNFLTKLYYQEGIEPNKGFYPKNTTLNLCAATNAQSYVVGPRGELYKCWEDVGIEHMEIGSLHNETPVTTNELLARYAIQTDPFNDEQCATCPVLPICGGECVRRRLMATHFGEPDVEVCSPYKKHLIEFLTAYYDSFTTRETFNAILENKKVPELDNGFRIVSPPKHEENTCQCTCQPPLEAPPDAKA